MRGREMIGWGLGSLPKNLKAVGEVDFTSQEESFKLVSVGGSCNCHHELLEKPLKNNQ